MADTKISDLTALTGADAATTDVFPVVDVSANTTKKMTRAEMFQNTPPIAVTGTLSATDKLTLTSPSTAQSIEIRNRASDNVYSGIYFKTNDGVTDQTIIQNERVGTNGGRFLFYTKADGGALTNNCILDSTGLTLGTGANLVMASATTVRLGGYTVATLPAAGTAGRTAYVTDATAPTYLGALTGGGAVVCPVFDNGVAWVSA